MLKQHKAELPRLLLASTSSKEAHLLGKVGTVNDPEPEAAAG